MADVTTTPDQITETRGFSLRGALTAAEVDLRLFGWVIALLIGAALGAIIGAVQGFVIAYIGVPSFVVTLGGLLSLRGLVYVMSQGAAVAGLDPTFQLIGGSAQGSIGGTLTWVVAAV